MQRWSSFHWPPYYSSLHSCEWLSSASLRLQSGYRWTDLIHMGEEPLSDNAPSQGLYIFAYLVSMAISMFIFVKFW